MSSLPLKDQVYLKLGEALHRYQAFEIELKLIIAQQHLHIVGSNFKDQMIERLKPLTKQTLGNLVNQLFETLYGP